MKYVLATKNAHKVRELQEILTELVPGIELVAYDGPEPIEDGDTFEANALIKARAAYEHTGLPALADDSGICVDALGGAPGIHSARYAGNRSDKDNLELLLKNMEGVEDRTAAFVCAAALVDDQQEVTQLARWEGWLALAPSGSDGFGYDPIFEPEGYEVTAADLTPEEKNAVSHRTMAFTALAENYLAEV
ncbi:MAG: RdgB/HAM1 family non-canonical purine NTP pyrophosphatase [Microbacteriaceae bacterium]|nr:RdgB/HAM1 family non-canonical purine NTP pyrophosphatase [Microbacteriaceae bacterium]